MNVPVDDVEGLEFTHAVTRCPYGRIRKLETPPGNHPASRDDLLPFAEDEGGNAFVLADDGRILFWDHETDDLLCLAADWATFRAGCHTPEPVVLDPAQVKAAWIDPEFAKQMGLDVPPDGYIKKP